MNIEQRQKLLIERIQEAIDDYVYETKDEDFHISFTKVTEKEASPTTLTARAIRKEEPTMTDEQINAIAREYAVEITKDMAKNLDESSPMLKDTVHVNTNYVKLFLKWFSNRYAIVEKSKLTEEYYEAEFTCGNVDPCSETFKTNLAQKSLLERLFPELFKNE